MNTPQRVFLRLKNAGLTMAMALVLVLPVGNVCVGSMH